MGLVDEPGGGQRFNLEAALTLIRQRREQPIHTGYRSYAEAEGGEASEKSGQPLPSTTRGCASDEPGSEDPGPQLGCGGPGQQSRGKTRAGGQKCARTGDEQGGIEV